MEAINGQTEVYAVLGKPVRHSLSPQMHNAAFSALGINAVYVALEVEDPSALSSTLRAMRNLGFRGANVTVPLKEAACAAMDRLDPEALRTGSVNTVQFTQDALSGFSTDGYGFVTAYEEAFGVGLRGSKVLVLGAGGAGRAVALTVAGQGAASMVLCNRTIQRAQEVSREITSQCPNVQVSAVGEAERVEAAAEVDVIIQSTSVGLHEGDVPLLDAAAFRPGQRFFDLVYSRNETVSVRAAREGGADAVSGLGMLLHQGAKSFSLWTGKTAPLEVMHAALLEALK